jgi:ketosteroid isomerase-like protein
MVQNFSGFVNLPLPLTPAMAELTLNGAFIIQVEAEKVVSGSCYFDRVAVAEQLQPK